MANRFIVKKVKIAWRNSMLAGNPVERSFTKFGVYDRNWKDDYFCCCLRPGDEWATNSGQFRKYRLVVDDHELALKIADRLNDLFMKMPNAKMIEFNCLNSWIEEKDIDSISIKNIKA